MFSSKDKDKILAFTLKINIVYERYIERNPK